MSVTPVGILISGSGSNMVALVRAMQEGHVPGRPTVVISNEPAAAGIAKAADLGVETAVIDHRGFKGDREAFDAAVNRRLRAAGTEVVACAGFMRIMTPVLTIAFVCEAIRNIVSGRMSERASRSRWPRASKSTVFPRRATRVTDPASCSLST